MAGYANPWNSFMQGADPLLATHFRDSEHGGPRDAWSAFVSVMGEGMPDNFKNWLSGQFDSEWGNYLKKAATKGSDYSWTQHLGEIDPKGGSDGTQGYDWLNAFQRGSKIPSNAPTMRLTY